MQSHRPSVRPEFSGSRLAAALVVALFLSGFPLVVTLFTSCATSAANTQEAVVRSSLSLLADVVDPFYQVTVDGCQALQNEALLEGEESRTRGNLALAQKAADKYRKIADRCVAARHAFGEIRDAHEKAAALVEAGDFARAQAELTRAQNGFRVVREQQEGTPQ